MILSPLVSKTNSMYEDYWFTEICTPSRPASSLTANGSTALNWIIFGSQLYHWLTPHKYQIRPASKTRHNFFIIVHLIMHLSVWTSDLVPAPWFWCQHWWLNVSWFISSLLCLMICHSQYDTCPWCFSSPRLIRPGSLQTFSGDALFFSESPVCSPVKDLRGVTNHPQYML